MSIHKISRKSKPFLVRFRENGILKAKTFSTLSEAENFELQLKNERIMPDDLQLSGSDRVNAAQFKALCNKYNISPSDALDKLAALLAESTPNNISIADAISEFTSATEKKGARWATVKFYQNYLNRFLNWAQLCGLSTLNQISHKKAQDFIDATASQKHAQTALRAWWNFLIKHGYATVNIWDKVEISHSLKDKKPIHYLTAAQTAENLAAIRPEFKPLYALMTFAGIRPLEIIKHSAKDDCLCFDDIDFKNKKITIRASVSKTRSMRIIQNLPPNIWEWLKPIKTWKAIYPQRIKLARKSKWSGDVETSDVAGQWRFARAKLPHKLKTDSLRHSFATHAYYALSLEQAVEILGHDYSIFKRYYKGLSSPKDAKAYFEILPKK